jgi:tRNA-splicing endonuclease subunit Sen34
MSIRVSSRLYDESRVVISAHHLMRIPMIGDPLRYHSHFTATVQTTPQSSISAQELIAAGRLGTAVKKAHLLCSVKATHGKLDDDDAAKAASWQRRLSGQEDLLEHSWGEVDFVSLTWAGFGV